MALTAHAVTAIESAIEQLDEIDAQIEVLQCVARKIKSMNTLGVEYEIAEAAEAVYIATLRLVEQQNRIRATVRAMPR
jgi:hypothetical protein